MSRLAKVIKQMEEPALREQLSNYVARRVTAQAHSLVVLFEECDKNEWEDVTSNQQLLETSEKLAKLAKKLPNGQCSEITQKISLILKLKHAEDKPSHSALQNMRKAVLKLSQHLESEKKLNARKAPNKTTQYKFALDNSKLADKLMSALGDAGLECSEFKATEKASPNTCTFIDINYEGKNNGFSLADEVAGASNSTIIFVSQDTDDFATRLKAVQHHGAAFITGKALAKSFARVIREVLDTRIALKPHIAVLDDSLSQLKYVENAIIKNNLHCSAVSTPEALLEVIEAEEPDLILLDLYLPECTGIELAQILKQHPRWKKIPLIFLSAEEDDTIAQRARDLTNAPFLTKPVKAKDLASEISKQLDLQSPKTS